MTDQASNRHGGIRLRGFARPAVSALVLALAACTGTPVSHEVEIARAASAPMTPLIRLADRLADHGQFAAAIPLYRQAYADGDGARALSGLARALVGLGRYAEADSVLKRGDARKDMAIALEQGEVDLALARPALALEAFDTALALGESARAHSGRAVALDALGRHEEALEAHARAVDLAGEDLNIRSNMALSRALHDDLAAAIATLEKIVAQPAAQVQHRQNLVLAYVFAGEEEKAARMAAIDLDARSVGQTIAYFRELHTLPPAARVQALVYGAKQPERDLSDVAVLVIDESEEKAAAAKRVVAKAPPPPPEPAPEPEPEPEPVKLPPLVDPEGWSVQVAAYRTAEQLVRGQKQLWERYADILGPLEPRRSEVDFGDRETPPRGFFYRLNAGPLKDYAEAREICDQLRAIDAPCWIRPPEPSEGRLPGTGGGD
ncbi:MAG: tetratricopeptide repeat protein [Rhodothalassiaceae bacterium]